MSQTLYPFTMLSKGLVTSMHPFRPSGMQLISSGFTRESTIKKMSGHSSAEILMKDQPEFKAVKSFSRLKATRNITVDM